MGQAREHRGEAGRRDTTTAATDVFVLAVHDVMSALESVIERSWSTVLRRRKPSKTGSGIRIRIARDTRAVIQQHETGTLSCNCIKTTLVDLAESFTRSNSESFVVISDICSMLTNAE